MPNNPYFKRQIELKNLMFKTQHFLPSFTPTHVRDLTLKRFDKFIHY